MPLIASHGLDSKRRVGFVGRARELKALECLLLERLPDDGHRLVALYAQGGQGKSALLTRLRESLVGKTPERVPSAFLDLSDSSKRDAEPALIHLRHELHRDGLKTPAFDVAFARAFSLAHPGKDMRHEYPEFFSGETSVLGDLVDVLGTVADELPGGKLVYTYLAKASSRVRDWYRREGHAVLEGLDDKPVEELRRDLPMYLGYDLCCYRKRNGAEQPVVFVDTYEGLWEADGIGGNKLSSGPDAWLRRLVEESPGILFVVAGRRAVNWARVDTDWTQVIHAKYLDALDDSDVNEFLGPLDIREDDVRLHIKEVAKGHPLTLQLMASTYRKLRARGRIPALQDFPRVQAEVLDNFFSHLDRPSLAVIRALAIPSSIPPQTWDHFRNSGFSAFDLCTPVEILGEAFFTAGPTGPFHMHESVREGAIASLRDEDPMMLRRLQLCIVDLMDRATSPDAASREGTEIPDLSESLSNRDPCFQEAARILLEADERLFVRWSIKKLEQVRTKGGSNLRRRWIAAIGRILHAQEHPEAEDLAHLAKLQVESNPFSARSLIAIKEAALALAAVPRPPEAVAALREAMWHASQVRGGRLPLEPSTLRVVLNENGHRSPNLDVRLALSMGDIESLNAIIEVAIEAGHGASWELVEALAAIGEDAALRYIRQLARRYASSGGAVDLAIVDMLLLRERPSWAMQFLEVALNAEQRSDLVEIVAAALAASTWTVSAHQYCLLVIECLLAVGDRAHANMLLLRVVPAELWSAIVAKLTSPDLASYVTGDADWTEWVKAVEAEHNISGFLQSYVKASLTADPSKIAQLSDSARGLLDRLLEDLFTESSRGDGANIGLVTTRIHDVELGRLKDGGIVIMTTESLFCNRTCDYLFWGTEGYIRFHDARRGIDRCDYPTQGEVRREIGEAVSVLMVWKTVGSGQLIGMDVPLYLSPDMGFESLGDSKATSEFGTDQVRLAN